MVEGSFMKALFFGVIAEDVIFPFPELPEAEREKTRELVDSVKRFLTDEVDSAKIDHEARIPDSVHARMRELGLFGLSVPELHGGLGLSCGARARVIQEIASADASLATMLSAHEDLGAGAIVLFGSEDQKKRYLPKLASGELTAAFALAEEGSGTDSGMMRTYARLSEDGASYLLNGTKRWVTNGDRADVLVVFARTNPPDEGAKPRITALIVERGPGVGGSLPAEKLGIRGASVVDVTFNDVVVPVENALTESGKGFGVAMEVLTNGRPGLSAAMIGQARALVNLSVERVQSRRSFGRKIGEFPIVRDKIAKMMSDAYAIESMTYLTAGLVDQKVEDFSLESAISRVAGSEALWRIVNDALGVAAGSGYVKPFSFERRLRDARATFVIESTNDILRCFIALAGMQGPGKRLGEVVASMREPVKGFGLLREFAVRKVKEALRRERMSRAHPTLSREAVLFEDATEELARAVAHKLREHGREISEMQYTQMRVSNVAIDLYGLAACISRTTRAIERRGEEGARRQIDLTTMFATAAQGRMRRNLEGLEHNDDDLRKLIAARTYTDKGYPFDVI